MFRSKPPATLAEPTPPAALPLLDRIAALRAEIDKAIDAHVEEIAKTTAGVPKQVLRGMLTNRAPGCQCRQAAHLPKEDA